MKHLDNSQLISFWVKCECKISNPILLNGPEKT